MITDTNKEIPCQSVRQAPCVNPSPAQLFTIRQFALAYPAFTQSSLRNLIFKAGARHCSKGRVEGNGLLKCGAIIRVGRRILIDEQAFFAWVRGNANVTDQGNGIGASSVQPE
jgi:hypothetical protein